MYPSPDILGWSDQGGWDGWGMQYMEEKQNAYKVLVGKPEEKS